MRQQEHPRAEAVRRSGQIAEARSCGLPEIYHELNLEGLPAGLYWVCLYDGQGVGDRKRLVKILTKISRFVKLG